MERNPAVLEIGNDMFLNIIEVCDPKLYFLRLQSAYDFPLSKTKKNGVEEQSNPLRNFKTKLDVTLVHDPRYAFIKLKTSKNMNTKIPTVRLLTYSSMACLVYTRITLPYVCFSTAAKSFFRDIWKKIAQNKFREKMFSWIFREIGVSEV